MRVTRLVAVLSLLPSAAMAGLDTATPPPAEREAAARARAAEVRAWTLESAPGLGKKLEWDGPNMRCTNLPDVNRFLARVNRTGWESGLT